MTTNSGISEKRDFDKIAVKLYERHKATVFFLPAISKIICCELAAYGVHSKTIHKSLDSEIAVNSCKQS